VNSLITEKKHIVNELQLIIYQQTVNQLPFKLISAWTYIFAGRKRREFIYLYKVHLSNVKLHRMSANWASATTAWSIQNQHTSCKVLALRDKYRVRIDAKRKSTGSLTSVSGLLSHVMSRSKRI